MASVDINITIDLPDGDDPGEYIKTIQQEISKLTGLETNLNVSEVDSPMSLAPIKMKKWNTGE